MVSPLCAHAGVFRQNIPHVENPHQARRQHVATRVRTFSSYLVKIRRCSFHIESVKIAFAPSAKYVINMGQEMMANVFVTRHPDGGSLFCIRSYAHIVIFDVLDCTLYSQGV